MIIEALEFKSFVIKKMNRNSVTVENKVTGEQFYMARRILNTVLEHPKTPLFVAFKEWNGIKTMWLAAAMTF